MDRRPGIAALLALLLVLPVAGAGAQDARPCAGTITSPANGTTVISVQGQRFTAKGAEKTPARIVAVGPTGEIQWVYPSGRALDTVWSYDVDPLPGGNLFVTATLTGGTVFYELDPGAHRVRWEVRLPLIDTHDADLLDRHRILIANMRNYNETTGENDDRLLIYNRTAERIEWEWDFRDRYPRGGGGDYRDDWTHVNDVDRVGPGRYLASVRNFDQVILVNRSTGAITLQLGRDDQYGILHEQHNPQYLESTGGNPVILIADSGNNRIVEYERTAAGWNRTWTVAGAFNWPRDADRLPNGNTLIADSINNRVVEVTPTGEIVWEVYAPWLVYDVERIAYGDEAGGPATSDLDATGNYQLSRGEHLGAGEQEACARAIREAGTRWERTLSPSYEEPGDLIADVLGQPGSGVVAAVIAAVALGAWWIRR